LPRAKETSKLVTSIPRPMSAARVVVRPGRSTVAIEKGGGGGGAAIGCGHTPQFIA
jgi:hypothetical protein